MSHVFGATTLHEYATRILSSAVNGLNVPAALDPCIPNGWSAPALAYVAHAEPVDWPCDYLAVWWDSLGYVQPGTVNLPGDSAECGPIPVARFCVRLKRCKDDIIRDGDIPSAADITAQSQEQAIDAWLLTTCLFDASRTALPGAPLLDPGATGQPLAPLTKPTIFEATEPIEQEGMLQGVQLCFRVPVVGLTC